MRWKSAEARELAVGAGVDDPQVAIRARVRQVLAEAGVGNVPVPFAALFKTMGVRKVRPTAMLLEGALRPAGESQFDILVREDRHVKRQRFTIAHELGHLLFYRFAANSKAAQQKAAATAPQEEERLCNVAAEELLMPEWFVQQAFSASDDALTCVRTVARDCQVSLEAAVIRCSSLIKEEGAVQLWRKDTGWRLALARKTGRARVQLNSYVEYDGEGHFINIAARADTWRRDGWLRSIRPSAVIHSSTRSLTVGSSERPVILVQHVIMSPGERIPRGDLTAYARQTIAEARKTPPDRDCATCLGTGWVLRADAFARCKCRVAVLSRQRQAAAMGS